MAEFNLIVGHVTSSARSLMEQLSYNTCHLQISITIQTLISK